MPSPVYTSLSFVNSSHQVCFHKKWTTVVFEYGPGNIVFKECGMRMVITETVQHTDSLRSLSGRFSPPTLFL